VLRSYKGRKTACCSTFKCKNSHARVSLKAKNTTKIEMRIGQNVTAMDWSKLQWVNVSHCNKTSTFSSDFRVDEQSECRSSKTLQDRSVAVVKCHSRRNGGKNVSWSFCGWTIHQGTISTYSERALSHSNHLRRKVS
jgi:hypothetical protein